MYMCASYGGHPHICDYLIDQGINTLKLNPHPLATVSRFVLLGGVYQTSIFVASVW
jgi:hypothetical protein